MFLMLTKNPSFLKRDFLRYGLIAVTASTAVSASSAATSKVGAGSAWLHGTGFVDHNVSAVHLLAIEHFNGFLGFLIGSHLDKSEAFGSAGEFVGNDAGRNDSAGLRERVFQISISGFVRKTPYVKLFCHLRLYPSVALESRGRTKPH